MRHHRSYRDLLYQYEVVKARLKIREHYLKTAFREVYDNIGQVLSLIRVQLSLLRAEFETVTHEKIDSSGELIGRIIRDLRTMCRLFHPEADMTSGQGFNRAVEHEIKVWYPEAVCYVKNGSVIPQNIHEEKAIVSFGILLEILTLINKRYARLSSAVVKYTHDTVSVTIDYQGARIEINKPDALSDVFDLSFFERATLLGGCLEIKNEEHDKGRIKLVIPIS